MTQLRISEAARLLGLSDDTVRRMVDLGRLDATTDEAGVKVVDGTDVARLATDLARTPTVAGMAPTSARNTFTGLVTAVTSDAVMSQVELQAGPFRVVSLLSTEAVRELDLKVGDVAVASVKSTNVTIGVPA